MKQSITIAIKDGKSVLLAGPEVPADKQRNAFDRTTGNGASEVQLWQPNASVKVRRFNVKPSADRAK